MGPSQALGGYGVNHFQHTTLHSGREWRREGEIEFEGEGLLRPSPEIVKECRPVGVRSNVFGHLGIVLRGCLGIGGVVEIKQGLASDGVERHFLRCIQLWRIAKVSRHNRRMINESQAVLWAHKESFDYDPDFNWRWSLLSIGSGQWRHRAEKKQDKQESDWRRKNKLGGEV